MLEPAPAVVTDLLAEISAESATLGAALHTRTAASLADLVRVMNAYYSNLIEGNNTRPNDIVRALAGEFDTDEGRRNLQFESAAHVRLQAELDRRAADGSVGEPAAAFFIRWLHEEFYRDAPPALLRVRKRENAPLMQPGKFRSTREDDVIVGRHQPPSSTFVDAFMAYFERSYRFAELGKSGRIIAIAAAHHRLNYIHPFPDGNGRVSRLMSHAMAHEAGIGAGGLWSVSRGLARGLENRGDYLRMMDYADTPRENDFDGRGNLSQRALTEFITWFLRVCLDQIRYMSANFELKTLRRRTQTLVERDDRLRPQAAALLDEAILRGEFERGEASRITGLPERTARRVLNETVAIGLLASDTPKGPVSMRFTPDAAETLFPLLF